MRIIGGLYKGRTFEPPSRDGVRPTTDMAREALFNVLTHRAFTEDAVVIDLFAGSGSVGFEFISRGASQVFSIEKDPVMASFIKQTALRFGMSGIKIMQADAFRFLVTTTIKADIVFADPPYGSAGVNEIPDMVFNRQILLDEGWLIVEHDKTVHFGHHPRFIQERRYGKVHFSFFQ